MIKVWNTTNIQRLYSEGMSSYQIVRELNLPITARQVQRIVSDAGITRPIKRSGRTEADGSFISMQRPIIDQLLQSVRGLDPYFCVGCRQEQVKKCDIHHTKYEGATLYDLQYLCHPCNTKAENRGLA
jgi:hypothetical protein